MSDERTNEELVTLAVDDIAEVGYLTRDADDALAELVRRADEAAVYKLALGLMGKRFESLDVIGPELAEIALDEARKALAEETDE